MGTAEKRVPVKEDTWEELGRLKGAGQTYDELIEHLIEDHKKAHLFRNTDRIIEESEFVSLEEA